MAVSLDQFIPEQRRRLELFETWWRAQNAVNPEHFPLSIPDDDAGTWDEHLMTFDPEICSPEAFLAMAAVRRWFVGELSADEVTHYERRLAIAKEVQWVHGRWYAIGDKEESAGGYPLFQCQVEAGQPFLGPDDGSGHADDFKPVWLQVYQGCVIIPQA